MKLEGLHRSNRLPPFLEGLRRSNHLPPLSKRFMEVTNQRRFLEGLHRSNHLPPLFEGLHRSNHLPPFSKRCTEVTAFSPLASVIALGSVFATLSNRGRRVLISSSPYGSKNPRTPVPVFPPIAKSLLASRICPSNALLLFDHSVSPFSMKLTIQKYQTESSFFSHMEAHKNVSTPSPYM